MYTIYYVNRHYNHVHDLLRKSALYGGVAQLGEHLPCKQGVKSSNLSISIQFVRTDRSSLLIQFHNVSCYAAYDFVPWKPNTD